LEGVKERGEEGRKKETRSLRECLVGPSDKANINGREHTSQKQGYQVTGNKENIKKKMVFFFNALGER
jgi:hypothetical protein